MVVPILLTETEAAQYLSLPVSNLRKYRYQNIGPQWLKLGTRKGIRYRQEHLDAWLVSRTHPRP